MAASNGSAVGICARITPYWSFSSSKRGRHEIEVGRHRGHQRPAEAGQHADRADHRRIAAVRLDQQGTPIAAVITGKAAKALPMIIVNNAMPSANTQHRQRRRCLSG